MELQAQPNILIALLKELSVLLLSLRDWIVLLIVFTFFFLTCNVETVTFFGRVTKLPLPHDPSFAAAFFLMLVHDIAPANIPLIVTDPMTAFLIQAKLALLLSIFFTFPVFLAQFIAYLAPALYRRELRFLTLLIVPLCILFAGGVVFAYRFIAPETFSILYGMAGSIQVVSMLGVSAFIDITVALLFATGAAFTIPVFMVLLTAFRLIPAAFWVQNLRYAFVLFLVVSAIITPDGSGVSMVLLSFPVCFLYGAGATIAMGIERVKAGKTRALLTNNH